MFILIPKTTQIPGVCLKYSGQTLDHVITPEDYDLVRGVSVSSMLSHHFLVNIEISLERPFFPATSVSYRKYRLIDINTVLLDI